MKVIQHELNIDLASANSTLGSGRHGLIEINRGKQSYLTVTGHNWMRPINPGPVPMIPQNVNTATIRIVENEHKEMLNIYKEYITTNKTIRKS